MFDQEEQVWIWKYQGHDLHIDVVSLHIWKLFPILSVVRVKIYVFE